VTRVAGVDGCVAGWVAVILEDGAFAAARLAARFADLVDDPASVIGVDIPLGSSGFPRDADVAARELLGPRRSSVFDPPPPEVLDAADLATANRIARATYGRGVSAQAWTLRTKMRDVEPHWHAAPDRIAEVHPEVSFRELGAGQPMAHAKRTWAGVRERTALLAGAGIEVPDDLGRCGDAGADDVLDAAVVAWTATRRAAGTARSIPNPPEHDDAGRPVAIWC
jgi:predicted RNase H-like nuclease